MGCELAQPDAGDAGHGTTQLGGGSPGNHAVYDGPEEGGAGGISLPVPSVPSEVCPLDTERFRNLDRIVSKALRRILKLDARYPAALLYMGLSEGGMGCVRLSDLVHTKLSLIPCHS